MNSSLAIDIHIIKNGKTKRTWHFEDWASAVPQLLRDEPAPTFRNPSITPGEYLIEVPQSIDNFYAKILRYVQCGDASRDSFKGDTEISYIETP